MTEADRTSSPSALVKIRRELATNLGVFGRVFGNRDLRRVLLAFVGFSMAEWGTWIAILVYAHQQSGPAFVGVIALIQLIPAAIFAPFAATLGDRHRRERVLLLGYVLMSASMGAAGAAMLLDAPSIVVYAGATATATVLTMVRPVHAALLPSLARLPAELTAANVASGTIENLSLFVGPAITAVILATSGPGEVFAVMAALVAISAFLAARVKPLIGGEQPATPPTLRDGFEGFAILGRSPRARLLIGLFGGQSLVLGALDVLIVIIAIDLLGIGESGAGLLNSAMGAGGLIGSAVTFALIGRTRLFSAFRAGIVVYGVPLVVIGLAPVALVASVMFMASGAGRSVMDVTGRTMLQRLVPDATLARVFGVLEGMVMATSGIGAVVASGLVAQLGTRGALIVSGLFLPIVGFAWRTRIADLDVGLQVPVERIELLRSNPIFAPLPAPALESVATDLEPLSAAPGEAVIRQGEPGDRFYLIEAGVAVVHADGVRVATLGSGDGFGEIALLRNVPRIATVVADGELKLLALSRERFLEAVTGTPASGAAADAVVRGRLPDE